MFYRLYNSDTQSLLAQPETRMGYQIVEVQQNYTTKKMVVLNAELAFDIIDYGSYRKKMLQEGFRKMYTEAGLLNASIRKVYINATDATGMVNEARHTATRGALQGPKEKADGKEVFVRLSAYENDLRVDTVNKCLKPGSFTTTMDDYLLTVAKPYDPVARYALPNTEVIKWAFFFQPKNIDTLQRGIVQPANNQPGGGKEVFFEQGTTKGTFIVKTEYGKK
ncbi:MAG: hypothetical protein SFW35_03290 [Chitinophagales bacterium]|nr:hypothetical protein [Chitinophagales bacterium]